MSVLWTRAALEEATYGEALGDWRHVSGVSIDTRSLRPGDLFVALEDQRDGHDFVADALEKGAAAALVSRRPEDVPEDAPLLLVDEPLNALESIGAAARDRTGDLHAIAVTGSAGKTGVKEALRSVLSPQAETHASVKSYNNHWGVPLTLARMPGEAHYGVFEIGMNHPGEITPLVKMVRPQVAVVTTVAPVHLGNFRSEADIAAAKAEIVDGLEPDGVAVFNRDNRWFDLLATKAAALGARVATFGADERADVRLLRLTQKHDCSVVEAEVFGAKALYRVGAPGRHHALNSLAVLAAAVLSGADLARAALVMGQWRPGEGRGARRAVRLDPIDPASAFELIDESYNANPLSLRAALETLGLARIGSDRTGRDGRRIAVIGDMLELGPEAEMLHAEIATTPEMAPIDKVYACGQHSRALYEALDSDKRGEWCEDSAALGPLIRQAVREGDVVMIKGSLGSRMARVVESLTLREKR